MSTTLPPPGYGHHQTLVEANKPVAITTQKDLAHKPRTQKVGFKK